MFTNKGNPMLRISVDMDACADHVEIAHGDLERFRLVARYIRDGHDVGILGCGRSLGERAEAGVPALT